MNTLTRTAHPRRRLAWAGLGALLLALLVLLVLLVLPAPGALAQAEDPGSHRAGLVIVHGDGSVTQQCVAFAEESISGYELLKRSQRALSVEAGAIGATVCSIDGEGCSFPQQSCFCQCQGSPCVYWSYWRQSPTGWLYQNLGAGNTQVRDGDVEGWHWAEGTTRTAKEPPAVSFADLCAAGVATTAVTATNSVTGAAASTAAPAEPPATTQGTATAVSAEPAPVSTTAPVTPAGAAGSAASQAGPSQEAASANGAVRLMWFVLLGLMVLPVAALAVLALLRRGSRR